MEPCVARGHGCWAWEWFISEVSSLKRRWRKVVSPAEQKRDRFGNYVDSPLCRERQLILCFKAGSQVKRGCGQRVWSDCRMCFGRRGQYCLPSISHTEQLLVKNRRPARSLANWSLKSVFFLLLPPPPRCALARRCCDTSKLVMKWWMAYEQYENPK